MIALIVACALVGFAPHSKLDRSIAHIERALGSVPPLVQDSPGPEYEGYTDEALADVQTEINHLVRSHGPQPALQRLIARCLMRRGMPEQAAVIYRQLGDLPDVGEFRQSLRCAGALRAARKLMPTSSLIRVAELPNRPNEWVALCEMRAEGTGSGDYRFISGRLLLFNVDQSSGAARRLWTSPVDDYGGRDVQLAVTKLDGKGRIAVVVSQALTSAVCWPSRVVVFRVAKQGLVRAGVFKSAWRKRVWWCERLGGLVVSCAPTHKVDWEDHYLWRNGSFEYANALLPEAISQKNRRKLASVPSPPYTQCLWGASLALTLGKTELAMRWLRAARFYCARLLTPSDPYYEQDTDGGRHGDRAENLKEIEQRILWLKAGDLNHALLYRPYDWDLQVPPYKLGRSEDIWGADR